MADENLVFRLTRKASLKGVWVFSVFQLQGMVISSNADRRTEDKPALIRAADEQIDQVVASGLLVRVSSDLFVCPSSPAFPRFVLETLVDHFLPFAFNYVSLETILFEHGAIDHPPPMLTVVTTGASGIHRTHYGTIEFLHTNAKPRSLMESVFHDDERGGNRATLEQARSDVASLRYRKRRAKTGVPPA